MTIETLRQALPDYAKDIKVNLGKLLTGDAVEGLSTPQVQAVALASAYATRHHAVMMAAAAQSADILSDADRQAARAAATIMGMNNVYYRFVHLVGDQDYGRLPANLRMTVIGNPGIAKIDFELMCLAVSAINGCGMCMEAHARELIKHGVDKQGVQSAVRIAAVLAAAAQALEIESI